MLVVTVLLQGQGQGRGGGGGEKGGGPGWERVPEHESTILRVTSLRAQDSGTWAPCWALRERRGREKGRQRAERAPHNPPSTLREQPLCRSQGAMETDGAAASARSHQPHMERKMSAMTCEIFNELRLEGKLCDVVIKVNGFEFNAHKNILCSCSSYFRYDRVAKLSP